MRGQTKEPQYQSHVEMAEQKGLIGSIRDVRFRDFWFSDKNKFFKVNPARACNHHCVANEKNRMILEYLDADAAHLGFV